MLRNICIVILFLFATLSQAQYKWKKIGELHQARHFFGAEMSSPREVLVAGGFITSTTDTSKYTIAKTCELLDIVTGNVYDAAPMSVPRAEFPLLMDKDSNLIAIGGVTNDAFTQGGSNLNTTLIEKYDRKTGKWSVIGNTKYARRQHCAEFFSDHEILIVAGRQSDLSSIPNAEIFNLNTLKSQEVVEYPYSLNNLNLFRSENNDLIGFAGRNGGAGSSRFKEVFAFNRVNSTWNKVDTLYAGVNFVAAAKLFNEKVLVCGGATSESGIITVPVRNIAIQQSGKFVTRGMLIHGRSAHSVVQIDNDHVVICGGWDEKWKPYRVSEIVKLSTMEVDTALNIAPHVLCKMMSVPTPVGSSLTNMPRTIVCISGQTGILFDGSANAIGITLTKDIEILTNPGAVPKPCQSNSVPAIDYGAGFNPVYTTRQINTVGNASLADNHVRLVPGVTFARGSMWFKQKLPVGCGFSTDFTFKTSLGNDNGNPDGSLPGADGIALVVQNSSVNALGGFGEGIGYSGILDALAVEFDTYKNDAFNDVNGNHVAVQTGGTGAVSGNHVGPYMLGINRSLLTIKDDTKYFARVEYNLEPNVMKVYLDEVGAFASPVLTVSNLDLQKVLQLDTSNLAYIGFTSSTGGSSAQHDILTWRLCTCPVQLLSDVPEDEHDETPDGEPHIRPNPATGIVHIDFSSQTEQPFEVQVYNYLGEKVLDSQLPGQVGPILSDKRLTASFDSRLLPVGCYFLRCTFSDGTYKQLKFCTTP